MSPDLERLLDGSAWVRNLARSLVGDPHTADDLVQEAWIVAMQREPQGADRSGLRRWITTVMRNLARDRRRSENRRHEHEGSAADARRASLTADEPSAALDRLDTHRRLVEAVRSLDEPYRTAVMLRYLDGLKPAEIARRLGIPVRTVHSRLNRALAKLRTRLSGELGGDRGAWLLALLPLTHGESGWLTGLSTGALMMDAKLKLTVAGLTVAGVAAVATLSRDGLRPADSVIASPAAATEVPLATRATDAVSPGVAVGREPAVAAAPAPVDPGDAPVEAAEVPGALEVHGRVVDPDGRPLAGIPVGIHEYAPQSADLLRGAQVTPTPEALATSGPDGRFTFELGAECEGALPWGELVILDDEYVIVLQPTTRFRGSQESELVLVAARERTLTGVVIDTERNPLAGAEVTIEIAYDFRAKFTDALEHSNILRWKAVSGDDGQFEIGGAPRLDDAVIVALRAGFAKDFQPLSAGTDHVEIVLGKARENTGLLEGTVVDGAGQPVEGAYVALEYANGTTDAAGRFALRLRGPGDRGVLMALEEGSLPARLERCGASNLDPRAWPTPLVLTLGGPPLTIRGRVLDASGGPIEGAKVWTPDTTHFGAIESPESGPMTTVAADVEALLADPESRERRVSTAADGSFELRGLLDKEYRVSVHDTANVGFHQTEPIPAGTTGLVVQMPLEERHERVRGRVVDSQGDPYPGARISLCQSLEPVPGLADTVRTSSVTSDEEGRFELRDVPVSMTHAQVNGPDLDFMANRLAIPDGADYGDLELVVVRRCRARIELAEADGASQFTLLDAEGNELMVTSFRGNHARSSSAGNLREGRSEIFSAPETTSTVVLRKGYEEVRRATVELRAGELNVLRL